MRFLSRIVSAEEHDVPLCGPRACYWCWATTHDAFRAEVRDTLPATGRKSTVRDEVVSKIGGPRIFPEKCCILLRTFIFSAEIIDILLVQSSPQVLPILDWKLFKCGYNMSQISGSCRMGDVFLSNASQKIVEFLMFDCQGGSPTCMSQEVSKWLVNGL